MIASKLLRPRKATCSATYRVQRSPTHTLYALSAENLSRTLVYLPSSISILATVRHMGFKDRQVCQCVQLVHVKSCSSEALAF